MPSDPIEKPQRWQGFSAAALIALYIAAALLPLILGVLQQVTMRSPWHGFSAGLAMTGYAMLLMQFLSSGRLRAVSGRSGIDLTMRFHQLAGIALLGFLLAHPLLYAVPRLGEGVGAALGQLNRMFGAEGLRSGVVAWWLLILLIPSAIWRDRLPGPYELWRASHGIGAALIAGLGTHHTLRVGSHSADPLLAAFWIALTALALLSLFHVYVVKPLAQRHRPWEVASNRQVAERTWEIRLKPRGAHWLDHEAGQFVWLNLGHSPFSLVEHPFSISSAPGAAELAFTIKESGDFTRRIGTIAPGTLAYIDGPHSIFTLAGRAARPLVLIAGGVGVAPVMGILRDLAARGDRRPVHLVYGNRRETQILHRDELDALKTRLDLTIDLVLAEPPPGWAGPGGQLTPAVLTTCLPAFSADTDYFICGPTAMMDSAERMLAEAGVPAGAIVSERFRYD